MKVVKQPNLHILLAGGLLLAAGVLCSARADYQSTVLSQGPAAYWRLDQTTQPPAPPIPAVNAGSLGAAGNGEYISANRGISPGAIVSEPANGSVQFPGTVDGNRVRIPWASQWNQTGPFSVELWVQPAQTANLVCPAASVEFIASPVTQRNGWLIYQGNSTLATGGGFVFRIYNSTGLANQTGVSVNMALDTTKWYHVVATFDGTNLRLYTNGFLAAGPTALAGTVRPNSNTAVPLTFGARADGQSGYFTFPGSIDEPAMYTTALSAAQVLAHYQAGTNASPATPYQTVVLADSPAGYWRLNEPADPLAVNLGTLGSAANGRYFYPASAGQPGPSSPEFPGLGVANKAVTLDGSGNGNISAPALNLNTNGFTLTCWAKPNGPQVALAGLVMHRARLGSGNNGSTAGLHFDVAGGLNLAYNWDGDASGINWASGVSLNDAQWNFVSLVVQPDKAVIYVPSGVAGPTTNVNPHGVLQFEGTTYIGMDPYTNTLNSLRAFNGSIDEVAVFRRALSIGEVYSQYAAAVGNLPPTIFADLAAPSGTLYAGDPLTLTVDAGGTPDMTFQWRKGGSPITDATNSTYTIPVMTTGNSGNYDVVIANAFGTTNSATAAISVQATASPTVTENPGPSRKVYVGGQISLKVVATGGGITYQWKKDGADLTGQTNATLLISNVVATNAGVYSVALANSAGNANSATATITVPSPATGSYEAVVARDLPRAWYRLDETVGSTAMLDSMGRFDGYYTNLNQPANLGVGGALQGSGNTAVNFPAGGQSWGESLTPPVVTGDYTIEAWVRTTNLTASMAAVSTFRPQYGSFIWANAGTWRSADGYGDWDVGVNVRSSALGAIQSAQWTHIVTLYSGGTAHRSYVNGQWDGAAYIDHARNRNTPFRIGVQGPYTGQDNRFFDGDVDEVAVYNKALTDAQISEHYAAAKFGGNTAPFFLQQPTSAMVLTNTSVSFVGVADGSYPVRYQWYRNGAPVATQTNTTYTIASAQFANNGDSIFLVASNGVAMTTSAVVTLNVRMANPTTALFTNDLVLHLKFDGNYNDTSGRGNNGTAVGSPQIVAGKLGGGALKFATDTGASTYDYVTLGKPADFQFGTATDFSVGYWVRTEPGATNGDLPFLCSAVNSYGNPGITFAPSYNAGGWSFSLNGVVQVYGGANSINNGNWHHVLHSFDRTGYAVTYLDGVQVDSRLMTGAGNVDTGATFNIGQDPTGTYAETGQAEVDDMCVWRRSLTAYEAYAINYVGNTYGKSIDVGGAVNLSMQKVGSNLQFIWESGTLYEAPTVTGPWTPVAQPSFYQVPIGTTGSKFYKVF